MTSFSADSFLKICAAISLLTASSGIGYYYGIHLPAREAQLDANSQAAEIAKQTELCRQLTASVIARDGPPITNTNDGQSATSYHNRYSPELRKCFLVVGINSFHTKATPQFDDEALDLQDLTENKEYGFYFKRSDQSRPMECNVVDKNCTSREEWDNLAKPYIGKID